MVPESVKIYLNKVHNSLRAHGLQRLIPHLEEREYIRMELVVHFAGLAEVPIELDWIYAQYTGK